jgi:hypothetical protein
MPVKHLLIGSGILRYILPILLPRLLCNFAIGQAPGIHGRAEPVACRQRCRSYWALASQCHRTSFRESDMSYTRHIDLCNLPLVMDRCLHSGRTVCLGYCLRYGCWCIYELVSTGLDRLDNRCTKGGPPNGYGMYN